MQIRNVIEAEQFIYQMAARILPENQVVKKSPTFYGIRRTIIIFKWSATGLYPEPHCGILIHILILEDSF
jgi:hypothetical protein